MKTLIGYIMVCVSVFCGYESALAASCNQETIYEDVSSGTRISCMRAVAKVAELQLLLVEYEKQLTALRQGHADRIQRIGTVQIVPDPQISETLRDLHFIKGDLKTYQAIVDLCHKDGCL